MEGTTDSVTDGPEVDPVSEEVVWRYHAPRRRDFYTASRGSNQRLANGNTLLIDSDNGNAFEITPEGERVWEFWAPHHDAEGRRATLVQTERYDVAFVERILAEVGSDGCVRPGGTCAREAEPLTCEGVRLRTVVSRRSRGVRPSTACLARPGTR